MNKFSVASVGPSASHFGYELSQRAMRVREVPGEAPENPLHSGAAFGNVPKNAEEGGRDYILPAAQGGGP